MRLLFVISLLVLSGCNVSGSLTFAGDLVNDPYAYNSPYNYNRHARTDHYDHYWHNQ